MRPRAAVPRALPLRRTCCKHTHTHAHTHTRTRTHAHTHTAAAHPQDDGNSRSAKIIARRLAREGYGKAYVLGGGFGEWKRASLRTREVTKVFVETVAAPKLAGTISGGRTVRGFLE